MCFLKVFLTIPKPFTDGAEKQYKLIKCWNKGFWGALLTATSSSLCTGAYSFKYYHTEVWKAPEVIDVVYNNPIRTNHHWKGESRLSCSKHKPFLIFLSGMRCYRDRDCTVISLSDVQFGWPLAFFFYFFNTLFCVCVWKLCVSIS